MFKIFVIASIYLAISQYLVSSCLITNCPRGGKRSGNLNILEGNIKPCVSCGPGRSGQCFGPNICCGPFGCLVATQETIRCQRDGYFNEREPCIAGKGSCRKNTGRCAAEGICCSQDSCHSDKSCLSPDGKARLQESMLPIDLYNFMNTEYAEN